MTIRTPVILAMLLCAGATAPAQGLAQASESAWESAPEPVPEPGDAAGVAHAARPGFEHVLPADCFAFLGIADVDALGRDMAASSWGRLLEDPACEALRTGFAHQWELLGDTVEAALGVDVLSLAGMLHGPFAIAVTSLPDPALDTEVDAAGLGAMLLADLGEDAEAARAILEQVMDRLTDDGLARATESVGDVEVTLLHDTGDMEPESLAVRVAFHGSTLVLALGPLEPEHDTLTSVLEALDGQPQDSLADAPAFRGSLAAAPGGVQLWTDLALAVQLGIDTARADEQEWADDGVVVEEASSPIDGVTLPDFLDKLGVLSLGSLAIHSSWDAQGMRSRAHIEMPGDGWIQGVLRALCGPGAVGHPDSAAADCQSMLVWHMEPGALFDLGLKIALDTGMLAPDELAAGLASMEEEMGFDLREDLLALCDGQVTTIIDETDVSEALPGTEDAPMNFAMLVGVSDSKAFNGCIEDLIRSHGLHAGRQMQEFQGHEIYSVPLPPIAIQYCMLPDALVISMSSTMLQDVLRHRAAADLPSLGNGESYPAALAAVSPRPGMLIYADAGKSTASSFETLHGAMQQASGAIDDGPALAPLRAVLEFLSSVELPDEATVRKHLRGGSITTVTVDDRGLWMESFQP
jgi:hypothetical protein